VAAGDFIVSPPSELKRVRDPDGFQELASGQSDRSAQSDKYRAQDRHHPDSTGRVTAAEDGFGVEPSHFDGRVQRQLAAENSRCLSRDESRVKNQTDERPLGGGGQSRLWHRSCGSRAEALSTLPTASFDNSSPCLVRHSVPETVLASTAAGVGLKRTLHDGLQDSRSRLSLYGFGGSGARRRSAGEKCTDPALFVLNARNIVRVMTLSPQPVVRISADHTVRDVSCASSRIARSLDVHESVAALIAFDLPFCSCQAR
jgi:hypothetical protein